MVCDTVRPQCCLPVELYRFVQGLIGYWTGWAWSCMDLVLDGFALV